MKFSAKIEGATSRLTQVFDQVGSGIDYAIETVSPQRAWDRKQARAMLSANRRADRVRNAYDGASRGRRTIGWTSPSGASVNAENLPALASLRARARDLVRNNEYAGRGVRALVNNVIGPGMRPSSTNDVFERRFKDWADELTCDADELHNFYGLQQLAHRTKVVSGEALIIRRRRPLNYGLAIPLQLQVLEPDYLDETLNTQLDNGNRIIQGVEFNRFGKRIAYWLFQTHPGDIFSTWKKTKRVRIPARDVIHYFDVWRAGQVRGVTDLASIIITLRDFDDYEDAQLLRQKIAACYTAFVRKDPDNIHAASSLVEDQNGHDIGEMMEPGVIEFLGPGEDIRFATPPSVEGYRDFSSVTLHKIAAGLDLPYEALTYDLREVNYSSARVGWLEFQRSIEAQHERTTKPRLVAPMGKWARESMEILGVASAKDRLKWTPPRREMLDPEKETKAAALAVRNGFSSRPEEIRRRGGDPQDIDAEYEADNKNMDERGFVFDSDARKQNYNGTPRTDPNQNG